MSLDTDVEKERERKRDEEFAAGKELADSEWQFSRKMIAGVTAFSSLVGAFVGYKGSGNSLAGAAIGAGICGWLGWVVSYYEASEEYEETIYGPGDD